MQIQKVKISLFRFFVPHTPSSAICFENFNSIVQWCVKWGRACPFIPEFRVKAVFTRDAQSLYPSTMTGGCQGEPGFRRFERTRAQNFLPFPSNTKSDTCTRLHSVFVSARDIILIPLLSVFLCEQIECVDLKDKHNQKQKENEQTVSSYAVLTRKKRNINTSRWSIWLWWWLTFRLSIR